MARIDIVRVKALCREGLLKAYVESGSIYLKDTINDEVVKLGDAPTVDPVKHGRWRHDVLDLSLCSCCLESFKTKVTKGYRFCPSCGAKMDGDAHE